MGRKTEPDLTAEELEAFDAIAKRLHHMMVKHKAPKSMVRRVEEISLAVTWQTTQLKG